MLTFHAATHTDIPILRSLAERICSESYADIISPEQVAFMLAWMYSAETIGREISEGVHWEIVRLDAGDAGFLSITYSPSGVAKLHKLYLLPTHHGKGLGQEMLKRVFALAAERGSREVRLQVNKANLQAQRAYERFGFVRVEEAVFEIGGGFVMNDYIMSCNIIPQ